MCLPPTPFDIETPLQACVARGGSSDDLVIATQQLTTVISAYKQAAKTVKGLCAKPKPKAKPAEPAEPVGDEVATSKHVGEFWIHYL